MKKFLYPILAITAMACGNDNQQQDFHTNGAFEISDNASNSVIENNSEKVVTILDQGLQLPMCQYTLPDGWRCAQDVASNPSDGTQMRHRIDFFSAKNQLLRNKGTLGYSHILGTYRDMQIQKLVTEGCGDISQLQFGQMTLNQKVMNDPAVQQRMSGMRAQGIAYEQLEIPFRGMRNGQQIQGRADIVNMAFADNTGNIAGGQVTVRLVISTPELFSQTGDIASQIDKSYRANPAHGNMITQLMSNTTRQIDANTAANTQAHEQRMNDMQNNFNIHQQKMAGMQQSFDQQNQQWMNQNFGSSGSTGNGYGNHEQFIDMINEQSTFADPNSGFNVHQDGQHDYWYTDGKGNYQGTDDINYDPGRLGNDWYQTEPLKPND